MNEVPLFPSVVFVDKSMAGIVAREAIRIQAGLGPSPELVLNNPSS